MDSLAPLINKSALLTGGSKGIGLGISMAMASERMKVAITSRHYDEVQLAGEQLLEAGKIRKLRTNGLRVLGDGQIDRALHVSAHYFTESAREKITKAGGTVEVLSL